MDGEINKVHKVGMKLRDDFWSLGIQDAKDVADTLINGHYKLTDACEFEKIGDDIKHWCLDNPETCIGLQGLWDRILTNGP